MFSCQQSHEHLRGPLCKGGANLYLHGIKQSEKESHESVQDVGMVEVSWEERRREVHRGGEGFEES